MHYLLTVFSFFLVAVSVRAANVEMLTPRVRSGEALLVKFDEAPRSVTFDGKAVLAFPYRTTWRAVLPLPLSAKIGTHRIVADFTGGARIERSIAVSKKIQKLIVLPPPPKLGMTAKEITQNLAVTNSAVRKNVEEVQDVTRFEEPFGLPLADNRKISSPFGEIRKIGEESITHLGTDFDAA